MSIQFNRDLSRVHDAMEGLVQCYQDNYKNEYEVYNLDVSKFTEDAIAFIKNKIDFSIPSSDLFFGAETGVAANFAKSRFNPPDLSLDSFVQYLKGLSIEETKLIVLSNLNAGPNLAYEELIEISKDESRTIDFLRGLKLSAAVKWEALEFFKNAQISMAGFIALVKKYIPVYKQLISKNKKQVEKFEDYIEENVKTEGKEFFKRITNDTVDLNANEIIVGVLLFRPKSLICSTVGETLYVFVGMEYEEALAFFNGNEEIIVNILKNFSDKTRFQILNLLKEKELYGQEIAEKVGITMATVSYHMSFLLASNLVKVEKVGQKGYYLLKKETLKKTVDFICNNFNL